MKRMFLLVALVIVVTTLGAVAANAVTKTDCTDVCVGTNDRDQLSGLGDYNTQFLGKDGADEITDTGKHDQDQVAAGAGNDKINVAEGGNADNEIDTVVCGRGVDRVTADQNDNVDKKTCEKIFRV